VRGQRAAGARVPVQQLEHPGRQLEQLDEAGARERRLLGRLVDDRVAGHDGRRDLPASDRDRVVPGHQQRDDAARLVHHQVGALPRALQRAAAVQRSELGVLLDRADAGLDAAERVGRRLAALARDQRRELVGVLAQPPGAGHQRGGALRGRGARPSGLRRAGGTHGGVGGLGRAGGDAADQLPGRRVEHVDRRDRAGSLCQVQDGHRLFAYPAARCAQRHRASPPRS
jgi:hypothetical protein